MNKLFCISLLLILFAYFVSCKNIKKTKFTLANTLVCLALDSNKVYTSEQLIKLLLDTSFIAAQKKHAQNCCIQMINKLSHKINYQPHYRCDFFGCTYPSLLITDSAAFIYRYDLNLLMERYKFSERAHYLNTVYARFRESDSVQLSKFILENRLDEHLNPIILEK